MDAPTRNHPSGHIDEANASAAKGQTMADAQTDRMIEAITKQIEVICKILGIDPAPMPNDMDYDPQIIQDLLDPDA